MERRVWESHLCALVSVLHLSKYNHLKSRHPWFPQLDVDEDTIQGTFFFGHFYHFILSFIGRSKCWGLDVAELQEGMESLGHPLMWRDREQGQSSRGVPWLLVLLISWLISGVSPKASLRGSCLCCPSSQPLSTGWRAHWSLAFSLWSFPKPRRPANGFQCFWNNPGMERWLSV